MRPSALHFELPGRPGGEPVPTSPGGPTGTNSPAFVPAIILSGILALTACSKERKAVADTGAAEAVVKTEAPASVVPDAQLQQQAQQAATGASTPVDGSGPVTTTTPAEPEKK